MVGSISTASPVVGAGESQVRVPNSVDASQSKDRAVSRDDVRGAALKLIQQALAKSETTGIDLDVLA
jgi:hypothetical protein